VNDDGTSVVVYSAPARYRVTKPCTRRRRFSLAEIARRPVVSSSACYRLQHPSRIHAPFGILFAILRLRRWLYAVTELSLLLVWRRNRA
jgi:hypothetical protein